MRKDRTEYMRQYRKANAKRLNENQRKYKQEWRAKNKEKFQASHHYQASLERLEAHNKVLKPKLYAFLAAVKLYYGCCNPGCCWDGPYDPFMLDFHHIDPASKENDVSQIRKPTKLFEEINKCTVLCANCHRLETWGQLDCSQCQRCNVTTDWKLVGVV